MTEIRTYNGNRNLKRIGEKIRYTKKRVDEIVKCREDILYFAEHYMKIVNIDKGLILIPLYDWQKEFLIQLQNNNKNIVLSSRQSSKCVFGNTKITIRNKKTGEILHISAEEFFKKLKNDELHRS